MTAFPPFATILRILISGENESDVRNQTKLLYEKMQSFQKGHQADMIYLGVMKSPIGRIQNKFRYQILMRVTLKGTKELKDYVFACLDASKNSSTLSFVEINPQNLS